MRAAILAALLVSVGVARADDANAQWRLGGRPHVEMPFRLDLQVDGFDDAPSPEQPKLEIANATVTPLGAETTGQTIQIIGNRRSMAVTWSLRYQVEPHMKGRSTFPRSPSHRAARRPPRSRATSTWNLCRSPTT